MTTVASPPRIVASVRTFVEEHASGPPAETIGSPMIRLALGKVAPETDVEDATEGAVAPPWMTILHNCECHTFEQVVRQLQKAIACSEAKGWEIAWQVHNTGKAVVKVGPEAECVRVGNILASIGLVVTVVQS
jgi:ATP-dependent Clp protease adaptor protein ClpS